MIRKKISSGKRTLPQRTRRTALQMLAACGFLMGAGMMQSCEKDLLTGQPEWLGNSIYERLQEGIDDNDGNHRTFETTLRLIDDLGYTNTLSKTGSKTVFATPDDAYDAWFAQKGTSYEKLSQNMKKQLFNNAMINNAYLLELMSNVSGTPPETGACMRRESSVTYLDSIPTWKVKDMPDNPMDETVAEDERINDAWRTVRKRGKDIHVFKDDNNATMIHFLPVFMQNHSITDHDLYIISNHNSNSIQDSWINGRKVISSEQTCKNGYIYVIDSVMDFKSNMANVINELPNTTMWASALNRFSCPVPVTGSALTKYRESTGNADSVFTIRYFNSSSNHGLKKGGAVESDINAANLLPFDPGWNAYYTDGQKANEIYKDAAVMIVPTDDAVQNWLEHGEGSDFYQLYGGWDKIDATTIRDLLNVSMLESFVSSVPSKFTYVLDKTSQQELGINESDIVKCYMCSNGVIYLVNKVFTPDDYSTVTYPAKLFVGSKFSVIGHAIYGNYTSDYAKDYDLSPYLGALDSHFELFIPYNVMTSGNSSISGRYGAKVFRMLDPCSYGTTDPRELEFYFYEGKVQGASYKISNGVVNYETDVKELTTDAIKNKINDLINNSVTVDQPVSSNQEYYLTKGNNIIYIKQGSSGMDLQGGYQMETGETITIPNTDGKIIPKSNGNTYCLCSDDPATGTSTYGVPMTAQKSVYQILTDEATAGKKCSRFLEMLKETGDLLSNEESTYKCGGSSDNFNISVFDSYNYTMFVPNDDVLKDLQEVKKYLPTSDEYSHYNEIAEGNDPMATEEQIAEAKVIRDKLKTRIINFLRYHIQDYAVMVHGVQGTNEYESAKLNSSTGRFYTITTDNSGNSMSVTDAMGNTHNVMTTSVEAFYNKVAREYWISNKDDVTQSTIAASSGAAVHMIDGALFYSSDQMTDWNLSISSSKRAGAFRK